MFKLMEPLPRQLTVAVSGGCDSMALLDFLRRNHRVNAVFFHHATDFSEKAGNFVKMWCEERNIPLTVGHLAGEKPGFLSQEEFWRAERYAFFDALPDQLIATAHTLDDCVETWIFGALHGQPKTIPYRRGKYVRPLILNRKNQLMEWNQRHNVPWFEDLSNHDLRFARNRIRHNIVPEALKVNPGLHNVVKRQLMINAAKEMAVPTLMRLEEEFA